MTFSLNQADRAQLDTFISCLMAPEALTDKRRMDITRQARLEAWCFAARVERCFWHLHKATINADGGTTGNATWSTDGCMLPPIEELLKGWRSAVVRKLLTPAPSATDVSWKKKVNLKYLPVTAEEVARAIAADEAHLAANSRRASKQRAGK